MFLLGPLGIGTLLGLYFSSLCVVPVATVRYIWKWKDYRSKERPVSRVSTTEEVDRLISNNVGTEYHNLDKYIELIREEQNLEAPR